MVEPMLAAGDDHMRVEIGERFAALSQKAAARITSSSASVPP